MRARFSLVVAMAAALLVACGDPGTGSPSGDAVAPTSLVTEGSEAPASATTGTSAPESVARCSDVAQITTDVLSDNAQGNIDPIFHGVLLTYAAEHADTFGGLWIDRDAFGTVVLAFTDDPAPHQAALAQRRPSANDVHAVEPPPEITDDRPIGEWDSSTRHPNRSSPERHSTSSGCPVTTAPIRPTRRSRDGLQFELGDLEDLAPAADVEPGLRSVLDDWLANPEGQNWPQDGWALLDADDERASFIRISDDGVSFVGAEMGANGWIWAVASGAGLCDVRLMLPSGMGEVEWMLDPSAPAPDPTSTEIRLLATERGCASGQEMGDRLLGPQVVETTDAVLVAFGVIPQLGDQACPGNPSTPVVVNLDAPLGDREIRDGMVIGPITSLLGS